MSQVFTFVVTEIGSWVTFLTQWSLYGIPFLYYFIGFVITGILMEFIFG